MERADILLYENRLRFVELLQCFQLSPSIFLFPYVRKVFDLPKFTDTLVSYLPRSGLGQYQLIDPQAIFSIGPNTKAAILVTSQAQL